MIEDVVVILERQLEFLLAQEGSAFFVQLGPYLDAISDDPRIKTILDELEVEAREALAAYDRHDAAMMGKLVAMRQELTRLAPELDDSTNPPGDDKPFEQAHSLARFDELAKAPRSNQFPGVTADTADPSTAGKLIRILQTKTSISDDRLDHLQIELGNHDREHHHALQHFLVKARTLSGLSYERLLWLRKELTPEPVRVKSTKEALQHATTQIYSDMTAIRKVVFESSSDKGDRDIAGVHARGLREQVRRLHEELIRRLYRTRSRRALINRFKVRCESYDRQRLRDLTTEKGRRENPLNAEAARFLFDNGLTPLISPEVGGLRPDILAAGEWTFYVESKQYGKTNGRRTIRKDAYQISDTASVLKAGGLREVYWLVFRREGPRYVLPDELRAEGIVVYPVHIDIASLEESGSRAEKPIEIPGAELLPDGAARAAFEAEDQCESVAEAAHAGAGAPPPSSTAADGAG